MYSNSTNETHLYTFGQLGLDNTNNSLLPLEVIYKLKVSIYKFILSL